MTKISFKMLYKTVMKPTVVCERGMENMLKVKRFGERTILRVYLLKDIQKS